MKNFLMKIILYFLFRGLKVLNGRHSLITKDIQSLPKNYKIKIETDLINANKLCVEINNNLVNKIKDNKNEKYDLIIKFKNRNLAFKVLMGQKGIADAFAEHYFALYGNIYDAMAVTRILENVEAQLFPNFICKKILKPPINREISIFKTYILCLFGGVHKSLKNNIN